MDDAIHQRILFSIRILFLTVLTNVAAKGGGGYGYDSDSYECECSFSSSCDDDDYLNSGGTWGGEFGYDNRSYSASSSLIALAIVGPILLVALVIWGILHFKDKTEEGWDIERAGSVDRTVNNRPLFSDADPDLYSKGKKHDALVKAVPFTFAGTIPSVSELCMTKRITEEPWFRNSNPKCSAGLVIIGSERLMKFNVTSNMDVSSVSNQPVSIRERALTEGQKAAGSYALPDYFEITVKSIAPKTVIAVGLSTGNYPRFRLCGWNLYSVGFHSDDGCMFHNDAYGGKEYDVSFGAGDTIGCGIDRKTGNVYFTKNGANLGVAVKRFFHDYLYANIGSDGACEISYNFGTSPFKFDPKKN